MNINSIEATVNFRTIKTALNFKALVLKGIRKCLDPIKDRSKIHKITGELSDIYQAKKWISNLVPELEAKVKEEEL